MRLVFTILFLIGITAFFPGRAQDYTVTFSGTTNATDPTNGFSSVPEGSPFTITYTFSASTAAVTPGTTYMGPGVENYIDPLGTASLRFGTFSFSGLAPEFQVFSGYYDGLLYGYEFTENLGNGAAFASQVVSSHSTVAPDTSLSSIQNSPFGNFDVFKNFVINTPNGSIGGVVTSFSVNTVAAPEPSSFLFSLVALSAFGCLAYRRRQTSVA